jgi:hypothetical protein
LFTRGNVGQVLQRRVRVNAKTPHIDSLCAHTECKGNTESIASSLVEIPFPKSAKEKHEKAQIVGMDSPTSKV